MVVTTQRSKTAPGAEDWEGSDSSVKETWRQVGPRKETLRVLRHALNYDESQETSVRTKERVLDGPAWISCDFRGVFSDACGELPAIAQECVNIP